MSPQTDHGPTAAFLAQLGAGLRSRRRAADLTAQELADRAGVSRRMLTEIEQGRANPSLVTVDKLARALGTDFAALAGAGGGPAITVRPPGAATLVWHGAAGGHGSLHLSSARVGGPELWEWCLQPTDSYQALPDLDGSEELILVQSGTLTIEVDDQTLVLVAGASARMPTDRGYTYRNPTAEAVRFVRVTQLGAAGRSPQPGA